MLARIRPFSLSAGVLLLAAAPLLAQINGVPASVTSFGFGGSTSPTPGLAASVTSLGPNGFGNSRAIFGTCCFNQSMGFSVPAFRRGHQFQNAFFPVAVYSVPYTQVVIVQPGTLTDDDEYDQGGPTIVDRRGSRASRPRERAVESAPAPQPVAAAPQPQEPVVAQPSTVLVFKDGHQSEVQNYAIVGGTLFDLTDNRSHKILLAELDLPATHKANDARGVDFQVPRDPAR